VARCALLAGLAIALLLPDSALGATASVATRPGDTFTGGQLTATTAGFAYVAGEGEANAPVLTLSEDGRSVTVRDAGAVITPGEGCTGDGAAEVRCETPVAPRITIELGDGDDVLAGFESQNASVRVDAGPGADTVDLVQGTATGGDGDDLLRATARATTLSGGAGSDVILGGPAGDVVDGGPGSDRLDGGAGSDMVSWRAERRPVTVDLSRPGPAGTAGEPDDVRDFEDATGGRGADLLRGTGAANTLTGLGGADALRGGGGDDTLDGGLGADRLVGGSGDDELVNVAYGAAGERDTLDGGRGDDRLGSLSGGSVMRGGPGDDTLDFPAGARRADGGAGNDRLIAFELDGSSSFVRCGAGRDRVTGLEADTLVPADCELLFDDDSRRPTVSTRVLLRGRSLRIPVPALCSGRGRCRISVALRAGSRRIAGVVRALRPRPGQTMTIRLGTTARGRIRRAGRVRLDYRAGGASRPVRMTVRPRPG
jgi:Ca2+-binding RTX toxin-like protein